jgi:ribonuclease-3
VVRARKVAAAPTVGDDALAIVRRATGHKFSDIELVRRALTHPSAVEDKDPEAYYERLEFLGDSVLGFLIAEEIFGRFPMMPEGGMTRIKVSVVSGTVLAKVSSELGLGEAIIFGDSERGTGGRGLASALENVYEALLAALYLDAGIDAAREWVLSTLGPLILHEAADSPENPKSALQELTQAKGEAPAYHLLGQSGPPHERLFTIAVEVAGTRLGEGTGHSKKEAEAAAAQAALERLARKKRKPRS